jgi:acetyl esterase/lipase
MLYLYVARNFSKIMNLEAPEPLANVYSPSFYRMTWILNGLDAGFWTARTIRGSWLRRTMEIMFSVYYIVAAEQADEKVRRVRSMITVDHLRESWNKGTTPVLSFVTTLLRPRLTRYRLRPRVVKIQRPPDSSYKEPVEGWIYYDGPISELPRHTRLVLDVPGGGFVSMTPRNHEDRLLALAGRLGIPILSLDYRKAPEYPYPYAVHEVLDVYKMLVLTKGQCAGLAGDVSPKIVVTGDSAGGNLACAMVLMLLEQTEVDSRLSRDKYIVPPPDGLVLAYPALDMNINSWMTDEQMALIKDRTMRHTNKLVLRKKSQDYKRTTGDKTPINSDEEDDLGMRPIPKKTEPNGNELGHTLAEIKDNNLKTIQAKPEVIRTRLAMSSMISYFNDRVLTPEMMRAMIILYVGPHNRPDFHSDYFLCPILAPESLLARFPKTCFITGERDPLVDDTVIFAGRIRQAKLGQWDHRKELGLEKGRRPVERDWIEISLLPGVSHGFMQVPSLYPDAWTHIGKTARWIEEIFLSVESKQRASDIKRAKAQARAHEAAKADHEEVVQEHSGQSRHHFRTRTGSSGDDDRPLEMSRNLSSSKRNSPTKSNGAASKPKYASRLTVTSPDGLEEHQLTSSDSLLKSPKHQKYSRHGKTPSDLSSNDVSRDVSRRGSDAAPGSDLGFSRRSKSLMSLASEEDLVRRRMDGFTQVLNGYDSEAHDGDDTE